MVGLSSVNAASDGKWTVTQISCHAGEILTHLAHLTSFGVKIDVDEDEKHSPDAVSCFSPSQTNVRDSQFTKNKPKCMRPI